MTKRFFMARHKQLQFAIPLLTRYGELEVFWSDTGEALDISAWSDKSYDVDYQAFIRVNFTHRLLGDFSGFHATKLQTLEEQGNLGELDVALLHIALAANADETALMTAHLKQNCVIWGEAATLLFSAVNNTFPISADKVFSAHRAGTLISDLSGIETEYYNAKREHGRDDRSILAVGLDRRTLENLNQDLSGLHVEIIDPFLASGCTIMGTLAYWAATENLPRKLSVRTLFPTVQGTLALEALARHLKVELEVYGVRAFDFMNHNAYLIYQPNDQLGMRVRANLKMLGQLHTDDQEIQVGGDAGDMLEKYFQSLGRQIPQLA